MTRLDRRAFGWDLRLVEFLGVAPVCCVSAFAVLTGLETAVRLDMRQGIGAIIAFFVGGLWIMAFHYLVATVPSILTWGLVVRLCRALGLGADAAVRVAAPATGLVASLLLFLWLTDPDYRGMIPEIAVVSVLVSLAVADRIVRSSPSRVRA